MSSLFSRNLIIKIVSTEDNIEVDNNNQENEQNDNQNKSAEDSMNKNSGDISVEQVAKMFNGEIIETNPDIISNK